MRTAQPVPWRPLPLDGRPSLPDDRGDAGEVKLQAVSRAERRGNTARTAALYGMPSFRWCRACDVQWQGDSVCWNCGQEVSR